MILFFARFSKYSESPSISLSVFSQCFDPLKRMVFWSKQKSSNICIHTDTWTADKIYNSMETVTLETFEAFGWNQKNKQILIYDKDEEKLGEYSGSVRKHFWNCEILFSSFWIFSRYEFIWHRFQTFLRFLSFLKRISVELVI